MPLTPTLYLIDIDGPAREVRDIPEALSLAGGDPLAREYAGDLWWLVAASCQAEAEDQFYNLCQGRHVDQDAIASLHADIANGLNPDLSPLRPTSARPDLSNIDSRAALE